MDTLPKYVILCGDYHIGIPSCDEKSANIFVAYADKHKRHRPGGMVQFRVRLPGLTREYTPLTPYDMLPERYDEVLSKNRDAVFELIRTLNTT